jgi:hypothetical protein
MVVCKLAIASPVDYLKRARRRSKYLKANLYGDIMNPPLSIQGPLTEH